jgi:hypothetical protein
LEVDHLAQWKKFDKVYHPPKNIKRSTSNPNPPKIKKTGKITLTLDLYSLNALEMCTDFWGVSYSQAARRLLGRFYIPVRKAVRAKEKTFEITEKLSLEDSQWFRNTPIQKS